MVADLHCHTKLSDSSMGIDDLVALAQKRGLDAIAITDKDCLAGIIRAKMAGERKGISIIPGVEISCRDENGTYCSILGYCCDSPDRLEGLCRRNLLAQKKAFLKSMSKLSADYPITKELILKVTTGSTAIYAPHIMHILMECGYTDKIYGDLYNKLFSKESETNVIEEPEYVNPVDVIEAIHNAGGIAIMSAPGRDGSFQLLDKLLLSGLDGIEVWSPFNSKSQSEELLKIANANALLATGGTCFMGMYTTTPLTVGDIVTDDAYMKAFLNYKTRQKKKKAAAERLNEAK